MFATIIRGVLAQLGFEISEPFSEVIAAFAVFGSLAITTVLIFSRGWLWLRRRFGDDQAIDDEQRSVVRLIKRDIETIDKNIERFGTTLNATFGEQLNVIATTVTTIKDGGNDNQEENQTEKRSARLFIAEGVRDTVVRKFLTRGCFAEASVERHRYDFEAETSSGISVSVKLWTPYRFQGTNDLGPDFKLDVWANGKKALIFEWSADGNLRRNVVYLSRDRQWFNELVEWSFKVNADPRKPFAAAAE